MQVAPQEIIRAKRDGQALTAAQVQAFVDGVAGGGWSEGQVAAMADGPAPVLPAIAGCIASPGTAPP